MMQLSRGRYAHTRPCLEWMTKRQVMNAARRGVTVGILPELWCFRRGEVQKDPDAAAEYSASMLKLMCEWAKENKIHLCFSLVGRADVKVLYHTAYLVGPDGAIAAKYRKAHLNSAEREW